jgi:hypothetical protein
VRVDDLGHRFLVDGALRRHRASRGVGHRAGHAALAEEVSPSKLADIKQLMEITGSANMGKQYAAMISKQIFQMLKSSRPDIPERVVDVMEELVKFTLLTRDVAPYLVDRYSERTESAQALSKRVNQKSI